MLGQATDTLRQMRESHDLEGIQRHMQYESPSRPQTVYMLYSTGDCPGAVEGKGWDAKHDLTEPCNTPDIQNDWKIQGLEQEIIKNIDLYIIESM